MFGSMFRPYGLIWRVLNTVTDVLCLSLLWAFCSLPIVTLGAATTALYDSCVRCIRYGEDGPYHRFFQTFKKEFPLAALQSLLWGGILAVGCVLLHFMSMYAAALAVYAYMFLLLYVAATGLWSCMIESRFCYHFRDLTETTLRISFGFLPATLVLAVMIGLSVWFCAEYWIPIAFVPACAMLACSLPAEMVFAKFGGGLTPVKVEE